MKNIWERYCWSLDSLSPSSGHPCPQVTTDWQLLKTRASMSLVAYGSSDESDSEESPALVSAAPGGLFSVLPAPKNPRSTAAVNHYGPSTETKINHAAGVKSSHEEPDPMPTKGDLFSSLPKPKKRSEPVRIAAPEIQRRDVSIE